MAAFERVLVEIAGGIGTLTLNRPEKLNAFDADGCADLIEALRMLATSDAVRVIIVTGAGRAFCAGADLAVLGSDGAALVAAGKEIALTIRSALACDYRLASDSASIGQVFHKLGLSLDWGGSYFLPRLVGISKALELTWSARMVPAAEAAGLGLFDRVVPHAELAAETQKLAETWAAMPPLAVRKAKDLLYRSDSSSLTAMLDFEIEDQTALMRSR